jgi:hypothetical protein
MYVVCVALSGLCSFSSLPRVAALKRLYPRLLYLALSGPRDNLSAIVSGYLVRSVMEALQGLNPPAWGQPSIWKAQP